VIEQADQAFEKKIQSKLDKLENEEKLKQEYLSESEESDKGLTRRKNRDVRTIAREKELKA